MLYAEKIIIYTIGSNDDFHKQEREQIKEKEKSLKRMSQRRLRVGFSDSLSGLGNFPTVWVCRSFPLNMLKLTVLRSLSIVLMLK